MTISQFLEKLKEQGSGQFFVCRAGFLRTKEWFKNDEGMDYQACPIEFVNGKRGAHSRGEELGLSREDKQAIICAADRMSDTPLRKELLQAVGLGGN